MFKKILSFSLIFVLSFSLLACESENSVTDEENVHNYTEENNTPTEDKSTETKRTVRLYYFDMEKLEPIYIDTEITVNNGALTKALTEAYKSNCKDSYVSINPNVKVTKANIEDGVLKVYFNEDFTKNVNLGTATEGGLVDALVSTYGYNFKVDKVALYNNNELYTGLKGDLPEGYFKVTLSGKTN